MAEISQSNIKDKIHTHLKLEDISELVFERWTPQTDEEISEVPSIKPKEATTVKFS
jgi:hypothetical protein